MSETGVPQAGASEVVGEAALLGVVGGAVMALGSDVVFVLDAETSAVVQANRAFRRVFGYEAAELPALRLADLALDAAALDSVLPASGEGELGVRDFRRKSGAVFALEARAITTAVAGRRSTAWWAATRPSAARPSGPAPRASCGCARSSIRRSKV